MNQITAKALVDPIERAGRRVLGHPVLCERAARLERLVCWIAESEELAEFACSRLALRAAVWFLDSWCAADARAGRFDPLLVLSQPPNEIQRELAADIAFHTLDSVLDDVTRRSAVAAIRHSGRREINQVEGQIIAEASNLDSIGPLWLWGQMARCAREGRSIASIVEVWKRQTEYHYWPKFIAEILRFSRSRELARRRCRALDAYFEELAAQLTPDRTTSFLTRRA